MESCPDWLIESLSGQLFLFSRSGCGVFREACRANRICQTELVPLERIVSCKWDLSDRIGATGEDCDVQLGFVRQNGALPKDCDVQIRFVGLDIALPEEFGEQIGFPIRIQHF